VLQAGSGTFPTFISVSLIDTVAIGIFLLIVLGVLWRYLIWRRTSSSPKFFATAKGALGTRGIVKTFFSVLWERVLLQKDVINKDRMRRFTHLTMFWGFVGLSVTTTLDYIFNRAGNYVPLFGSSLSTIRLLGNVSGVVMMIGATIAIERLIAEPKFRRARSFSDIWFTSLLFIVGLTGFIAEYYGELAHAANPTAPPAAAFSLSFSASLLIVIPYGLHIVVVTLLFVTAPFSFFIHALQVPSMRYMDSLGNRISSLRGRKKNELLASKESAMLDQIQAEYESKMVPAKATTEQGTEKAKQESG
jgi:nitrate reductase gamma subunit